MTEYSSNVEKATYLSNLESDSMFSQASTLVHHNLSRQPPRRFFASTNPPAVVRPPPASPAIENAGNRASYTQRNILDIDDDDDSESSDAETETESTFIVATPSNINNNEDSPLYENDTAVNDIKDKPAQPEWQEEATPAQTAFGKQLLFNRVLRSTEDDDCLSTASERGTVINANRMDDLNDWSDNDNNNENNIDLNQQSSIFKTRNDSNHSERLICTSSNDTRSALLSPPRIKSALTSPKRPFLRTTPTHNKEASQSYAFSLARSCFSFDAYNTNMDSKYEYKVPCNSFDQEHKIYKKPSSSSKKYNRKIKASQSWDDSYWNKVSAQLHDSSNARQNSRARALSDTWHDAADEQLNTNNIDKVVLLQTPERINVDKEDALDMLTSLVERGVSFKDWKESRKSCHNIDENSVSVGSTSFDIPSAIDDLNTLNNKSETAEEIKQVRKKALEVLSRSHTYALDMKRASQSASTWLDSIGRTPSPVKTGANKVVDVDSLDVDNIDINTAREMINTYRRKLSEKSSLADKLNKELAECRAEIGRLQSVSHSNQSIHQTPNKSVLDELDEGDDDTDVELMHDVSVVKNGRTGADQQYIRIMNGSFTNHYPSPLMQDEDNELAKCKAALAAAEAEIVRLRLSAHSHDDESEESPTPANVTSDKLVKSNSDRAFDSESYTSEWHDLTPSLPPPPDHELDSPIVAAVLSQWTEDRDLHQSLLMWVESILSGESVGQMPPLTVSNIDRQVRDGLLMHVLPLLLNRRDIRVNIETRVKHQETHDLAVSVDTVNPTRPVTYNRNLESTSSKSDVGSTFFSSVTHATPRNTRVHSGIVDSTPEDEGTDQAGRICYDEFAENVAANTPPGIMGTLGGAIGGLLTRRKLPSTSARPLALPFPQNGSQSSDEDEVDDQPYHRVVSAPPGRIGVTFVEFRGHAMVSEVAEDSPLSSWIFASDILIAIDELPVSGMRVRDIISVLKDRKNRQRALRVISCHAMHDLAASYAIDVE